LKVVTEEAVQTSDGKLWAWHCKMPSCPGPICANEHGVILGPLFRMRRGNTSVGWCISSCIYYIFNSVLCMFVRLLLGCCVCHVGDTIWRHRTSVPVWESEGVSA